MSIIYAVRADSPQAPPLARLIDLPLGLDIWQVKAEHVVLRAAEEQALRLRQMGYTTEEVVGTDDHLATFATAEAIAAYHSAETLASPRLMERRWRDRMWPYWCSSAGPASGPLCSRSSSRTRAKTSSTAPTEIGYGLVNPLAALMRS
jgi:hypothetical protein